MRKILIILWLFSSVSLGQDLNIYPREYGWDDLRIAGSDFGLGATAPSLRTFNSGNIQVIGFQGGTANDIAYFEIQVPHDWDGITEFHPHLHVATESDESADDTCVFVFEWQYAEIGSVFGSSTKDTLIMVLDGFNAWEHQIVGLSEIQPTVSTGVSQMFVCSLQRLQNHPLDNYAGWILVLEFDMHYRKVGFGSKQEYIR